MKKIIILLISMVCITSALAYAASLHYEAEEQNVQIEVQGEAKSVSVSEYALTKSLTQEEREFLAGQQDMSYCYQQLSEEKKQLYLEILWTILHYQENVTLSSMDKEEINEVFQCVLNDHAEIFYVNGYTYTQYTLGDVLKKITFTGAYSMNEAQIEEKQRQIDDYVNQCLSQIPKEADDYTKVKFIYEYIIEHTEYDAAAKDNQNICSVFLGGRSVCQGYAKATQYLLEQAGIPAVLVIGMVENGEGHAWNAARLDSDWYYVDTTWGDASYQASGEAVSYPQQKIPTINYDYLCVTTKQLCQTHTIDNVVEPPFCDSMQDNYYVREGVYISEIDEKQLEQIFKKGYEQGSTYVTIKCASLDIYNQLEEMLIINQAIFRYLNCPEGIVSYTDNEKQYSMSFWL